MATRHIIAVCGAKRSGKDTVASYLVKEYGFVNCKLAQPLKDAIKLLFSLTDAEVEGDEKEKIHPVWNVSPRTLMQFIGTDIFQFEMQRVMPHIGRNFWLHKLHHDLETMYRGQSIVISDLRFVHEYHYLTEHYPWMRVIRVDRAGAVNDPHSSETEFEAIPCNVRLTNDGTLEDLHNKIHHVMCSVKG